MLSKKTVLPPLDFKHQMGINWLHALTDLTDMYLVLDVFFCEFKLWSMHVNGAGTTL